MSRESKEIYILKNKSGKILAINFDRIEIEHAEFYHNYSNKNVRLEIETYKVLMPEEVNYE